MKFSQAMVLNTSSICSSSTTSNSSPTNSISPLWMDKRHSFERSSTIAPSGDKFILLEQTKDYDKNHHKSAIAAERLIPIMRQNGANSNWDFNGNATFNEPKPSMESPRLKLMDALRQCPYNGLNGVNKPFYGQKCPEAMTRTHLYHKNTENGHKSKNGKSHLDGSNNWANSPKRATHHHPSSLQAAIEQRKLNSAIIMGPLGLTEPKLNGRRRSLPYLRSGINNGSGSPSVEFSGHLVVFRRPNGESTFPAGPMAKEEEEQFQSFERNTPSWKPKGDDERLRETRRDENVKARRRHSATDEKVREKMGEWDF